MGCEVAPARDGFLEDSGGLTGADTLGCNLITDVNQTLRSESSNYAGQCDQEGSDKRTSHPSSRFSVVYT